MSLAKFVAVLSWLSFFGLIWATALGVIPADSWNNLVFTLLFLALALIAGLGSAAEMKPLKRRDDDREE